MRYNREYVSDLCSYHAPTSADIPKYAAIAAAAENLINVIADNTPECADQSDAIRKVREARMTANASIELRGKS